jgi:hypothetical protein
MAPFSARESAERLFHALAIGDGNTVAALLEMRAIQQWRDEFLAGLLSFAAHSAEAESEPSAGVAVIQGDSLDALIDGLLPLFGASTVAYVDGVSTIADAARLSPSALLAAAVAGEVAAFLTACPDGPRQACEIDRIDLESERVAQVHYARQRADGSAEEPKMLTLARTESQWLVHSGWLYLPAAVHLAMFAQYPRTNDRPGQG